MEKWQEVKIKIDIAWKWHDQLLTLYSIKIDFEPKHTIYFSVSPFPWVSSWTLSEPTLITQLL